MYIIFTFVTISATTDFLCIREAFDWTSRYLA